MSDYGFLEARMAEMFIEFGDRRRIFILCNSDDADL